MVSKQEVAEKIQTYLDGQISDQALDAWALDVLVREQEDYSIPSLIVGEAIGLLNMLHDENAGLRVSRQELENLRDVLQGRKAYQLGRLIQKNFTHRYPGLLERIKACAGGLLTEIPKNMPEVIQECKSWPAGTIQGLLLRHVANLLEMAQGAVRSGVVEPYVEAQISDGIGRIRLTELLKQVDSVCGCLAGEKPFILTIVGEPGEAYHASVVIS